MYVFVLSIVDPLFKLACAFIFQQENWNHFKGNKETEDQYATFPSRQSEIQKMCNVQIRGFQEEWNKEAGKTETKMKSN